MYIRTLTYEQEKEEKMQYPTIIFDWGGTLHDSGKGLVPQAREVLTFLAEQHDLLLVSLVSGDMAEQIFERCGLRPYFKSITFVKEDKDAAYEAALKKYDLDPTQVVVVDDRAIRGIAWGNRRGATTIWLRRGKWSGQKPFTPPTHIIGELGELFKIFGHQSH